MGSLTTIKRDSYPEVEFGELLITTAYPGASPEDAELNVTNKIEKELKELEGELEELEDTSMASGGRPSEAWLLIVFCTLGCFSTAW